MRTRTALDIWRNRPNALLVLLSANDGASLFSLQVVRSAGLTLEQQRRVVRIITCGDTVTYSADLSNWLGRFKTPGQLMVVTSPEHLERMTAIVQTMLRGAGWRVEGVASLTSERKPESPLRLIRDQLRAQIWRATGWSGRDSLICPGRTSGLF